MLGLVAASALAGCGASSQSPVETLPAAQSTHPTTTRLSEASLRGEKFISTKVTSYCNSAQGVNGTFQAFGNASGPYPGTFLVRGKVRTLGGRSDQRIRFHESFLLYAASGILSGDVNDRNLADANCDAGPVGYLVFDGSHLRYGVGLRTHRHGKTSVTLKDTYTGQSFIESFR
jgi:hypothetical protein